MRSFGRKQTTLKLHEWSIIKYFNIILFDNGISWLYREGEDVYLECGEVARPASHIISFYRDVRTFILLYIFIDIFIYRSKRIHDIIGFHSAWGKLGSEPQCPVLCHRNKLFNNLIFSIIQVQVVGLIFCNSIWFELKLNNFFTCECKSMLCPL